MKAVSRYLAAVVTMTMGWKASALILTGGADAVRDPGWPAGALALANLPTRAAWTEGPPFGGGQWTFFYRGGTADLQKAVDALAAIKAESLELVLQDRPGRSPVLGAAGKQEPYAWSFEVWVPERWKYLHNNPKLHLASGRSGYGQPVAAPRIDVWLGAGSIEWEKIVVPKKIVVRDARATSHGFKGGSVARARLKDANGKSVTGSWLEVESSEDGWKTIRAVGRAESVNDIATVTGLPAGVLRVVAGAPGCVPRVLDYDQWGDNDFKEFTTILARAKTLSGTVKETDGRLLAGVKVRLFSTTGPRDQGYQLRTQPEVASDAQGRWKLEGVPEGRGELTAHLDGYSQRWTPGHPIPVTDEPVALAMFRAGAVKVSVANFAGAGRQVVISMRDARGAAAGRWGGSADVSATGTHLFETVPPGDYEVSTVDFHSVKDAPPEKRKRITIEPGKTIEVTLQR